MIMYCLCMKYDCQPVCRCKNKRLDRFMLEEFAGAFKHRHLPPQSHLHTVINLNQGEVYLHFLFLSP